MKSKFLFYNFIYFITFWFINTLKLNDSDKIDIDETDLINGKNETFNQDNIKKFIVNIKANKDKTTDFIYVYLIGTNKTLIKYILSFYKEDSSQRNQLFQSYNNEINMWLTKFQFKESFYIEVECDKYPCAYNISIFGKENIEIKLGKIYSYYITNETEKMKFLFKDTVPYGTDLISVWANGNENISSDINGVSYIDNFYQFEVNDSLSRELNLPMQVNGTLNDIISIGGLSFNESNYTPFVIKDNIEISGFLSNTSKETNCFVYNHPNYFGNLTLKNKEYDGMIINFHEHNNSFCLSLNYEDETNETDRHYSFYYYISKNDNNTEDMNSPYIYGFEQTTRYIKESDSVLFTLVKPKYFFDYFIYHINELSGSFFAPTVYLCPNYPLCNYSNMKKMEIYQYSLDRIFFKKDLYDILYNPLNKSQIIVKITCEESEEYINEEEDINNNYIPGYCLLDLNTYNQNYVSEYKILEKNETTSYYISFDYSPSFTDINIEVIYGEISIDFVNKEIEEMREYKNKYIYEFFGSDIHLIITGKKEKNYFHIIYFPLIAENQFNFVSLYSIGGNYLFLYSEDYSLITFENKLNEESLYPLSNFTINDTIFIGFYPIKGKFSPKSMESNNMDILKFDGLTFYQEIKVFDKEYKNFSYNVSKNNKENEDCLFSVSIFNLNSKDGIILHKENPQLFKFSKENSVMKFTYFHKKNENNTYGNEFCWIEIKSENNSPMDLKVFINGTSSHNETIRKESEIKVNFTSQCFDKGTCNISFNLTLNDNSKSNIVKINIYTGNDYLFWIMLYSNIAILVIVIIIVLLLIWDYLQNNSFKIKESNQYQLIEEEEPESPLYK